MRLALPAVLTLASAPACLDPNPDFDGDRSTSNAASASSSSGPVTCEPDASETDGMMESAIGIGVSTYVLEEAGATDHFNMFVFDVGAGQLRLSADPALELCAYVGCDAEPGPSPVCIDPATSSSSEEANGFGCCATGVLEMTFDCPAQEGAKVHIRVSGATTDCVHYDLEVATSLP